jgi:hypothetical protein
LLERLLSELVSEPQNLVALLDRLVALPPLSVALLQKLVAPLSLLDPLSRNTDDRPTLCKKDTKTLNNTHLIPLSAALL